MAPHWRLPFSAAFGWHCVKVFKVVGILEGLKEKKKKNGSRTKKKALFKEIPGYDNDTPLPNNEYTYT